MEQELQVLELELKPHSERPLNGLINGVRIMREDADFENEMAPFLQVAAYIPQVDFSSVFELFNGFYFRVSLTTMSKRPSTNIEINRYGSRL